MTLDLSTLPIEIYADMLEEQGVDTSKLRAFLALGCAHNAPTVAFMNSNDVKGDGKDFDYHYADGSPHSDTGGWAQFNESATAIQLQDNLGNGFYHHYPEEV